MRLLIPIILFATAVGVYFLLIDPLYQNIQDVRSRIAALNEALASSKQVLAVRDELLEKFNSISQSDSDRIKKFLPDHVDNIRLILEVANIAEAHDLTLQDIRLQGTPSQDRLGPDESSLGSIRLELTLGGAYRSFRTFTKDLEGSLRLVDIVGLTFNAVEDDDQQYTLTIQTYWLKPP